MAILQAEYWTGQALEEKPDLISPKLSKAYKDQEKMYRAAHAGKYFISDTGKGIIRNHRVHAGFVQA